MFSTLALSIALFASQQTKASDLQIVVIAGENAVNIIQQRTAVAPIVEIRDRNGLPVAGAVVTFSVQGNLAAFPGAVSTFTAVTTATGQAVAAAVQPMAAGSFSIQVNAVFQGQTAIGAIAQSNVLTAAHAAAVGGSSGAAAGGSATAGGSGGVSATTLGIVGGAAAAGAAIGLSGDSAPPAPTITSVPPPPPAPPVPTRFALSGAYTGRGQRTNTATNPSDFIPCTETLDFSGMLSMTLEQAPDGRVSGTGATAMRHTDVALSPSCPTDMLGRAITVNWNLIIEGTAQSLTFDARSTWSTSSQSGTYQLRFTGRLENSAVSGTMIWDEAFGGTTTGSRVIPFTGRGSGTMDVVLR